MKLKKIVKNPSVIAGIVIGILLVAGFAVFVMKSSGSRMAVTVEKTVAGATPKPSPKMLTWDDPAGMTFSYPDIGLKIDKHDEDQDNYAHVEFTSKEASGSVIVWVKDLPVYKGVAIATIGDWTSKDPLFKNTPSLDTTLGGQEAKKALLSDENKIIIGSVYDGVLWYIEGNLTDKNYWQPVVDAIAGNFTFKPVGSAKNNSAAVSADDSSGGGSADEEETLQ